jgi:hypothetical protein
MEREATLDDGTFFNVTVKDGRVSEVLCDDCLVNNNGSGIAEYEDLQFLRAISVAIDNTGVEDK